MRHWRDLMSSGTASDKTVLAQAAEWNVRLDSGELSALELTQFHQWLANPRNAREFNTQRTVLTMFGDLSTERKAELERIALAPAVMIAAFRRLFAHPIWV